LIFVLPLLLSSSYLGFFLQPRVYSHPALHGWVPFISSQNNHSEERRVFCQFLSRALVAKRTVTAQEIAAEMKRRQDQAQRVKQQQDRDKLEGSTTTATTTTTTPPKEELTNQQQRPEEEEKRTQESYDEKETDPVETKEELAEVWGDWTLTPVEFDSDSLSTREAVYLRFVLFSVLSWFVPPFSFSSFPCFQIRDRRLRKEPHSDRSRPRRKVQLVQRQPIL
jgi:hypothetical protein